MGKILSALVWICTACAAPVAMSQEIYSGSAIGRDGAVVSGDPVGHTVVESGDAIATFGVRFDVGENWFLGGELQSGGTGPKAGQPMTRENGLGHAGLYVGYGDGSARIFGFIDPQSPVIGLGADIDVTDNVSIRLQTEFTDPDFDLSCCSDGDHRSRQDFAAGISFSF